MAKKHFSLLIIQIHTILAGFFLPTAIMFSITGGLYTFGNTGKYNNKVETVPLSLGAAPNLIETHEAAVSVLNEKFSSDPKPSGKHGIKKVGTSWIYEWTGSRADFTLEPTEDSSLFKATYKQTTAHRFFVQLHKAKGGLPFKVLAAGLALAFISLFASGVLIAAGRPNLRRLLYLSLTLGTGISGALMFMS